MSWGGEFWGGIQKGFGSMKLPATLGAPADPSQPQPQIVGQQQQANGQPAAQVDPLAAYGAGRHNATLAQIANGGKPLTGPQGPAGMGAGVSTLDAAIATLFGGTPTVKQPRQPQPRAFIGPRQVPADQSQQTYEEDE